ncbi:TPA: hypothetical protein QCP34_005446, partial [Bacillus anthracis]|nr:hypothetical protein [Bacillus anthracis]
NDKGDYLCQNQKSKIKKIVGALSLTSALLISAMPASAGSGLIWVRDKYPNAYEFDYNGAKGTVKIFYLE